MLELISDFLEGRQPPLATIMQVRSALHKTADIYRPFAQDLVERMRAAGDMDVSLCDLPRADLEFAGGGGWFCLIWVQSCRFGCSRLAVLTACHVAGGGAPPSKSPSKSGL